MAKIISTRYLLEALQAEGFPMPEQCREARMVMGVNAPFILQLDLYMSGEDLAKFGRALVALANAQKPQP